MLIIFHYLHIPGSSESLVKHIGGAALSHSAIASFFNTHHEDVGGLWPSNQDIGLRTTSISPALARSAPHVAPLKSPVPIVTASLARKPVAATFTPRHTEVHCHRHPVTARRTYHSAITSRRASPTSNPHNATTARIIPPQHQLNTACESCHDANHK
ncbi:hypothetical protein EDB86DRAFT_3107721 [Lactarius hatsudake]|nr:hypothetical protein EDB86DRAFT_3107721 [Lactarius hatsudake]